MTAKKNEITQDRISQLATNITDGLKKSISDIQSVNDDIHVLSINAKILAAKAGSSGKGFAVVADSVRGMVSRTQKITDSLQSSVESTVGELREINSFLGTKVRGDRLSQVAENMIDIVDRNLYERSCDVRWWATESAVVSALENPSPEHVSLCSNRLGVILDSYTVYLDIVACDLSGNVIANGRPGLYASAGRNVRDAEWFRSAIGTKSGNDYGFQGVHRTPLSGNETALVYSCGVRRGGSSTSELVGVLGIVFNWNGLGKVVVTRAEEMLSPETGRPLHARLMYGDGTIIASSDDGDLAMPQTVMEEVRRFSRGVMLPDPIARREYVAGYASSKGFETYRSGWYALIQEDC